MVQSRHRSPASVAAAAVLAGVALLGALSCQETLVDLDREFTLRGDVVAEADGAAIPGALVSLTPALNTVLTDANGTFAFAGLSSGVESYTLNIEAEGYRRFVRALSTETIDDDGEVVSLVAELELASVTRSAPEVPAAPSPGDDSTDVAREVTLRWSSTDDDSPDDLRFDLRFGGPGGIRTVATALRDTFFTVRDLGFGESYFWQVTAYETTGGERVNGPVWSFTTEPDPTYDLAFALAEGSAPALFGADADVERDDYLRLLPPGRSGFRPVYSPDGTALAYVGLDGTGYRIYVAAGDGTAPRSLTARPLTDIIADQYRFSWDGNGTRVIYGQLNEIFSVDAATAQTTLLVTAPANRKVTEVSAHPTEDKLAYRTTSADGLVTDVFEVDLRTGARRTILADTTGLVTGPVYSPSGNEVLITLDVSGQENARRRQLDARVFEIDLANGTRRLLSNDKPAGFNDLEPAYSPSGAFVYFTRGSNVSGEAPAIFRVPRDGRSGELVIPEGTGPTVR